MSISLPEIRVGEPIRHQALSVFPLFAEPGRDVDYQLSDTALAEELIVVSEVSESGSVPNLLVDNKGDRRVLFLEGEELVGAKQNRVLNTSVLVAPHTKTEIPVSCVEQGRWRYKSRHFASSGSHSPSKLRHALRASVNCSVKANRGHVSDQRRVWRNVQQYNEAHNVASSTAAMSDAFDANQDRIENFRESLKYAKGASGVAVAIGQQVVSFDVFDKPSTCARVWDRLLSGVVFDALQAVETDQKATVADVEKLLGTAGKLTWEQAQAVGEGDEFRAQSGQGDEGSALALDGIMVHGSVVTAG